MVANVQDVSPDILDSLTANNVTVLQLQPAMKRQVSFTMIIIFIYCILFTNEAFSILDLIFIFQGSVSVHLMSLEQMKNHVQCAKKIPLDTIRLQGVRNAIAQLKEQSTGICPVVWRVEIASKFCLNLNKIN